MSDDNRGGYVPVPSAPPSQPVAPPPSNLPYASQQDYQDFFHSGDEQAQTYPSPQLEPHRQHHEEDSHSPSGCLGFLKGCLGFLCCCFLFEECCKRCCCCCCY